MRNRLQFFSRGAAYVLVDAWESGRSASWPGEEWLQPVSRNEAESALRSLRLEDASEFARLDRALSHEAAVGLTGGFSRSMQILGLGDDERLEPLLDKLGYAPWSATQKANGGRFRLLRRAEAAQARPPSRESEETRRLDGALRQLGRVPLILRGESYRLVRAGVARSASAPDTFETLSERELLEVLPLLAADPQRLEPQRAALAELQTVAELQKQKTGGTSLLLLRQLRSRPKQAEDRGPPITPSQLRREQHWIEIQVVDEEEQPVPGLALEMTTSDGRSQELRTNSDGFARWEPIVAGEVTVRLPAADGSAWRALGGAAPRDSGKRGPARTHHVRQGECLARIVHRYGGSDWSKVWQAPENATLREKRSDPNVLLPGDVVVLPGIEIFEMSRSADALHRIQLMRPKMKVRVRLLGLDGSPLMQRSYDVLYKVDEREVRQPGSQPTDGDGYLEETVPLGLMDLQILLRDTPHAVVHRLSALDPASDANTQAPHPSGVSARLRGLGYRNRARPGAAVSSRAVARFQRVQMQQDAPSAEIDADTLDSLTRAHGV